MPDHLEPAGHVIERLGDVFADPPQRTAAVWTGAGCGMKYVLTRQLFRQRASRRLLCFDRALDCGCYAWRGGREQLGLIGLQCLDRQLELLGLMRQLLRRTTEFRPAIASELEAQLGDLGLSRDRILRHRRDDLLQRLRVVRQLIGRERHSLIESHRPPFDAAEPLADSLCRSSAGQHWLGRAHRLPPVEMGWTPSVPAGPAEVSWPTSLSWREHMSVIRIGLDV